MHVTCISGHSQPSIHVYVQADCYNYSSLALTPRVRSACVHGYKTYFFLAFRARDG